jgi:hypothetical protein
MCCRLNCCLLFRSPKLPRLHLHQLLRQQQSKNLLLRRRHLNKRLRQRLPLSLKRLHLLRLPLSWPLRLRPPRLLPVPLPLPNLHRARRAAATLAVRSRA